MRKTLLEGRTIKTAQDAINLLDSGKLAGRLGGKKFVPNWLTEQPDMFKSLVDLTLINIDDDPNVAGDEVIQFMILASSTGPERWQSVTIQGNALRTLRRYTFAACENLEHIVIPESVRKIYKGCFSSCHSLQQIDLPSRLIFLDEYVFSSCRSLKTITLPKGIAYIPSFCFSECTALETVKVSTKLAIVNHRAFGGCRNLTELTPYGDLDDFDLYSDVYFMPFSFDGSPFEEVLIAADAMDNDD